MCTTTLILLCSRTIQGLRKTHYCPTSVTLKSPQCTAAFSHYLLCNGLTQNTRVSTESRESQKRRLPYLLSYRIARFRFSDAFRFWSTRDGQLVLKIDTVGTREIFRLQSTYGPFKIYTNWDLSAYWCLPGSKTFLRVNLVESGKTIKLVPNNNKKITWKH